jgi:hypothetical protein
MTGRREMQTFHVFEDYKAKSWPHARRIVRKVEITKTGGTNIRYVVTNMSGNPGGIYRGFYVQRGNVPKRPIGKKQKRSADGPTQFAPLSRQRSENDDARVGLFVVRFIPRSER